MVYRIQHAIQDIDGFSKDRYVNTFYFDHVGIPTDLQLAGVADSVKAFYTAAGGGVALRQFIASHARGPGATVKIYQMTLNPTNPPIYEESYTFPDNTGTHEDYPSEVAVCLSFKADPVAGVDIKSQRGRVYIGPLNTSAGTDPEEDAPTRPSTSFVSNLVAAAERLKVGLSGDGATWVIYSPKRHKDLETLYSFAVTSASVDDAFDTQRRRGVSPTSKVTTLFP